MIQPSLQWAASPTTALARGQRTHQLGAEPGEVFGLAHWYTVLVPDLAKGQTSLGDWSGCSGLEVQLTPEGPFEEGGAVGAAPYLPGKVSYGKVTLERAMTARGVREVRGWLERQLTAWANGEPQAGRVPEAVVQLHSGPGRAGQIASWWLRDAIPVAWTVPPFSSTGGVAIERLTLAHGGFLRQTVPQQQLQLIEEDVQSNRLAFLFNPVRISLTQSREAERRYQTAVAEPPVVDVDSLKVTLPDLRLEGVTQVQRAVELLRRWVMLESAPGPSPRIPPAPDGRPPECSACHQRMPSPNARRAGARPRVLRAVWGTARGGLPAALVLKSFDLSFTRFTSAGEPCRATVQLILQDHRPEAAGRRGR